MTLRLSILFIVLTTFVAGCSPTEQEPAATAPVIQPKVVVVTMFERGADTGDAPGEFQLWNERRELDTILPFHGHHDLHYNADSGILAIVTGVGTAKAAASIMALGMDPRFDLSKSYWLVAGIAGFDPEDASLGSAAWAQYLVDGDLAHEIDAREIPADWQWGYIARHTKVPFDRNKPAPRGEVFVLNEGLTDWAYGLTRDIDIPDSAELAQARAAYVEHENAVRPPFVLRGDHLAALTFWHGEILNNWANSWVDYWSEGHGEFVSSAMEDTGTYQSISYLHNIGRADKDRVMVLRTASNYTMPPPGVGAAENLLNENDGYSGLNAAIESAYQVGSVVVDEILANWATYEDQIPLGTDGAKAMHGREATNPYVYHLVQKTLWDQAVATDRTYYPPTYEQDGFTHATANPAMLMNVANHFYKDVAGDWLCLQMTRESLRSQGVNMVFEGTAPVGDQPADFDGSDAELFPHIHGGIHPLSVVEVFAVKRNAAGEFLAVPGVTDEAVQ